MRFGPHMRVLALSLALASTGCLDWQKLETGRCGDGFTGPEETCDDGNDRDGDGCSSRCRVEPPRCGDGRTDPGEDCDDGGSVPGDGCSATCRDEPADAGVDPEPDAGPKGRCGDGVLHDEEACDDGNTQSDDACLNGCSRATCGDGFKRKYVEECDITSTPEGTSCTVNCLACGTEPDAFFRAVNQRCFTRHTERLSQKEARAVCATEGGELWSVTTKDEGDTVLARTMLSGRYWLGLAIDAGTPRWLSGETFGYDAFATPPGPMALSCVTFATATASFQPTSCATALPFVCERGPAFVSLATNHAYKLRTIEVTADEARARCEAEGGALAVIDTDDERAFVAGKVLVDAWVDARERDGRFVWPDGSELEAELFRAGQPDDAEDPANCVAFESKRRLIDEPCTALHGYLCEFD